jgi:hypothetical protein
MRRDTSGTECDTELVQLRATMMELAARLAQLEAESAAVRPPTRSKLGPPVTRASRPEGPRATLGTLPRRGLMAGVAALVAGTLGKAAPAEATHGGGTDPTALHIGQNNVTGANGSPNQGTSLTLGPGINPHTYILHVNAGASSFKTAIIGRAASARTGVLGLGSWVGTQFPTEAAGVCGVGGASEPGVLGLYGTFDRPPGYYAGVLGAAPADIHAVQGVAEEPGPLPPTLTVGVGGTSSSGIGVAGTSSADHGVFGRTSAPTGTVANGMLAAGVAGRTSSTIALYGYSDGPANPSYATVGGVGQCESGFGLWGISSAGPGATTRPGGGAVTAVSGVLGTSTNGVGMYAISSGTYALAADGNGPGTVAIFGRAQGGGRAGVFFGNVEINGHLTVTGGVNGPVSAAQADGSGTRQALPATVETVVAIGEGRLVGGRATVRLEAAAVGALPEEGYLVFLTENDDHQALYVSQRTRDSFEVRAKDSPTASGAFSYRVVARSRTARAATDAAPLHVPAIPVPQGVPTLPVGRETPPATKPDAR